MVPIIRVVGKSGSGKTNLTEALVQELKRRGYNVAAVKHSPHGFDMDREGKDTWRYAQSGADAVMVSSPGGIAMIRKTDHDSTLAELSRILGADFDIILAEGFKHEKGQKIEVLSREQGNQPTCEAEELLAVVAEQKLAQNVPQFAPGDTARLAEFIERRYLNKVGAESISLYVGNEPVPLNEFVRGMFTNILTGMISSLKRVPKSTSIDIFIRRKAGG
ncbi:MAG: molybdopterin-guanine dinucleotide biosynthesis protein B [Dehalococcoidia bacterium]|nr:molybdopterin-guanine dinucleotide biosynthesis protein B [Dehalococcoidia bacterium]